jgi:hypothetical protein
MNDKAHTLPLTYTSNPKTAMFWELTSMVFKSQNNLDSHLVSDTLYQYVWASFHISVTCYIFLKYRAMNIWQNFWRS